MRIEYFDLRSDLALGVRSFVAWRACRACRVQFSPRNYRAEDVDMVDAGTQPQGVGAPDLLTLFMRTSGTLRPANPITHRYLAEDKNKVHPSLTRLLVDRTKLIGRVRAGARNNLYGQKGFRVLTRVEV